MAFVKPDFLMLDTGGDISAFVPAPGLAASQNYGGLAVSHSQDVAASDAEVTSSIGLSFAVDVDDTLPDGARILSPGLTIQGRLDGGTGTEEVFMVGALSYVVQNCDGDGDAVGFMGRARKTNQSGNVGDACGVWGSAFQFSTELGGVMGLEGHIYQNATGNTAGSGYNGGKWSTGLHIISNSTGSPATSGILIGGVSQSGYWNLWNGLNFARHAFAHDGVGTGVTGTVGINMADFNSDYHPEVAWKLGYADGTDSYHIDRAGSTVYMRASGLHVKNPSGAAGIQIRANSTYNAFLDLLHGGTSRLNLFYDQADTEVVFSAPEDEDILFKRNGAEMARFKGVGLVLYPEDAVSLSENGSLAFELTSDTTLTIKARGSDGTTRSNTITLS